jgi:hypothetical protein
MSASREDWERLLSEPAGLHVAVTLLTIGTAAHLADHGIQPTENRSANLRTHLMAHRPQEVQE